MAIVIVWVAASLSIASVSAQPEPAGAAATPEQEDPVAPREPGEEDRVSHTGPGRVPSPPANRHDPPEYLNLRYDEDYSLLDEHPEAREADWSLRLKNIALGDRWRLDLGGEFRLRMVNRTNPYFGLTERTSNTRQNYRWLLHANLHDGKNLRLFFQGIVSHVESQDGPFEPTQENHGDIQQLFLDVMPFGDTAPLTVRLGRQELDYGHDRMIGAYEWVSNRRRFDGVKAFYRSERWDLDLFAASPVRVKRTRGDRWNDDYHFYGMYTTLRTFSGHGLDLYVFHTDRSDHVENPNGHIGGRSLTTAGARLWGKLDRWDYDVEAAGQWGHWAGDTVKATFLEADVGYTVDHPWHPRFGTGFGWASGDDDPFDRSIGTWDQLFTYDHVCISLQDLIGRQNIVRWYAAFEAWPTPRLKTSIFYHWYRLNEETDYYYNGGASPVIRDRYGHSGRALGQALEVQFEYRLDAHASVVAVYSHFWDGDYFHHVVGDDDDPDLFFVQFRYRF